MILLDDFITSALNNPGNLNDRIITISQAEIFDEIKRRSDFTTLMENTTRELAECIAEFGKSNPTTGGGCDLTACLQQCSMIRLHAITSVLIVVFNVI